jgi:hypothetical protein
LVYYSGEKRKEDLWRKATGLIRAQNEVKSSIALRRERKNGSGVWLGESRRRVKNRALREPKARLRKAKALPNRISPNRNNVDRPASNRCGGDHFLDHPGIPESRLYIN